MTNEASDTRDFMIRSCRDSGQQPPVPMTTGRLPRPRGAAMKTRCAGGVVCLKVLVVHETRCDAQISD
ncbi:hypothetical protein EYF80_008178 [Liparis tanakae]|uniref:Uncharacterized protein n=1 Tax=Liparis tanakae TaxID=230148 RepID=A0A4Z2IWS1_9TELE|nr:hypothetical protein EYF80_008178 [Liparis tanakae]